MSTHIHSRCDEFLGSLSDYIDGDLDPALCQDLETHMTDCGNCRIVVDTLRKTVSLYHQPAMISVEIPRKVRENLFKMLDLKDYLENNQGSKRK